MNKIFIYLVDIHIASFLLFHLLRLLEDLFNKHKAVTFLTGWSYLPPNIREREMSMMGGQTVVSRLFNNDLSQVDEFSQV